MRYLVTATVRQIIDAESAEEAGRIGRFAIDQAATLRWPWIVGDVQVEPDRSDKS